MTSTAVSATDLLQVAERAEAEAKHYTEMARRYRMAAAQLAPPTEDDTITVTQAEVLAQLNGTPRRLYEISRGAGRAPEATWQLLAGLVRAGKVRKVARGLYERCH